jgi:hypothetical protein
MWVSGLKTLTRNNRLFGSSSTKNVFLCVLIIRVMTFEFEYFGEFEFLFEKNLG